MSAPERPSPAYGAALARLVGSSSPGMRLGLESTRHLMSLLGDPQVALRGVLVAGTNGKGSVSAMTAEMALRAGHRVALLTKPHLTSYRERFRLGGEPIDEALFAEVAAEVCDAADAMAADQSRPTHHELLTGMGFLASQRWGAEVVVCEVGLGGRLDATNVWDGGIKVLTSISLDHQAQLGNTVLEIAREKSAVIKPGNLVVAGVGPLALPAVTAAARLAPARLWLLEREVLLRRGPNQTSGFSVETPAGLRDNLHLSLDGPFQLENAALAVAAADCLSESGVQIGEEATRAALLEVEWPGRLQRIAGSPEVLVDAAHNPPAVAALLPVLAAELAGRPCVLLFGAMDDHDHGGMLRLLGELPFKAAVFTRARSARAADSTALGRVWSGRSQVVEPVASGLVRARQLAGSGGLVVALGSIYVIGEVMSELGVGLPRDPEVPFPPLW